jgi:hypothetical protein
MLVFITHPKYFDKKSLYRKKPELVYIFNSFPLYEELSKKYKCINLDKNYNVKNENFFPEPNDKKQFKHSMVDIKRDIYSYFKKKEYFFLRKQYRMRGSYKDTDYKMIINFSHMYEREERNIEKATKFMEISIEETLISILKFEKGEKFVKDNIEFIKKIFNLMNSLYRAYIYSFCKIRGSEVYGDIFKFNTFLNSILYYTFDKYDIYENDFYYSYKKVLSRLFIENLHKNDIKYFVKANIEYQKEQRWL